MYFVSKFVLYYWILIINRTRQIKELLFYPVSLFHLQESWNVFFFLILKSSVSLRNTFYVRNGNRHSIYICLYRFRYWPVKALCNQKITFTYIKLGHDGQPKRFALMVCQNHVNVKPYFFVAVKIDEASSTKVRGSWRKPMCLTFLSRWYMFVDDENRFIYL